MGVAECVDAIERWPAARSSSACAASTAHSGARRQRGGRVGAAGRVEYHVGGRHPAARSSSTGRAGAHGASAEGGWVRLSVLA